MFTPEQFERLERALKIHHHQLATALFDPRRDELDLHVAMAGNLRALLCDADLPILLEYARSKNRPLPIWGPHPAGFVGEGTGIVLSWSALVASPQEASNGHGMWIHEYLDTAIGSVLSLPSEEGSRRSLWYTPRQLIKWVANKEGAAHFDLKPPAGYKSVQGSMVISGGSVEVSGPG